MPTKHKLRVFLSLASQDKLPVRLDDCALPRQLKDRQAIDYFPATQHTIAFDKLKARVRIRKDV